MFKRAIGFYKTTRPGLIIALLFTFIYCFGLMKAAFPEVFYEKVTSRIDTAVVGIAYYQNTHTLDLKLNPGSLSLRQTYPIWWYMPHPKAADLKADQEVSVYIRRSNNSFYGIISQGKVIQPPWFDILNTYFGSRITLVLMAALLVLIALYHYREVIKNPFLWLPYAVGILILAFFWGYVNPIICLIIFGIALKYILKQRKQKEYGPFTAAEPPSPA